MYTLYCSTQRSAPPHTYMKCRYLLYDWVRRHKGSGPSRITARSVLALCSLKRYFVFYKYVFGYGYSCMGMYNFNLPNHSLDIKS